MWKIFDKIIGGWAQFNFSPFLQASPAYIFFYFKAWMLELQKTFLTVGFFIQISFHKGLKAKISCFFSSFFSVLTKEWGWNVLEADRVLRSWHHIGWRNTKICIQGFHKWSDVVNVENHIFLKVNWEFLWVIWIKWK